MVCADFLYSASDSHTYNGRCARYADLVHEMDEANPHIGEADVTLVIGVCRGYITPQNRDRVCHVAT